MTDEKTIIYVAGPTAGGKTTVADMLEATTGGYRVRGSQLLAEMATDRGIPTDKASLQNLYLTERKVHGENFLAMLLAEKACASNTSIVIAEGIRRITDIASIEKINKGRNNTLKFMYIDASPDVRFIRYNKRLNSLDQEPITRDEFTILEENPAEDELSLVKEMVRERGIVIDTNTLTREEVLGQVQNFLNIKNV